MLKNNSKIQEANDLVNQAGGDPEKAFRDLCAQKGINPDDIIALLK